MSHSVHHRRRMFSHAPNTLLISSPKLPQCTCRLFAGHTNVPCMAHWLTITDLIYCWWLLTPMNPSGTSLHTLKPRRKEQWWQKGSAHQVVFLRVQERITHGFYISFKRDVITLKATSNLHLKKHDYIISLNIQCSQVNHAVKRKVLLSLEIKCLLLLSWPLNVPFC